MPQRPSFAHVVSVDLVQSAHYARSEPPLAAWLPKLDWESIAPTQVAPQGGGIERAESLDAPHDELTLEQLLAHRNRSWGDAYPLDPHPRRPPPGERPLECESEGLAVYDGFELKVRPVQVHSAFEDRLERFERLVGEVATEVYGRKPLAMQHMGAYACRPLRLGQGAISEHSFGNAIDVTGFDFGALGDSSSLDLPEELRGAFRIRVAEHWENADEVSRLHTQFLRRLGQRAIDESIFRVALGPSHEGHDNHIHFDMAPWRHLDL